MKKTKPTSELVAEGKVPPHYAVPKSDGAEAVRAWIALLPSWQADRAARIDRIAGDAFPAVVRAVRWHGAFYGVPGGGWFMAVHSFKAHLKLTFFDGASLSPLPPVALAKAPSRALDLRESTSLDDGTLAGWFEQAIRLPGFGRT